MTETEVEIGRARVDSNAIFEFKFLNKDIEKVILRGANFYAWLYIQPKATYFIELPEPTQYVSSMERDKEIEMLFFRLDSTDINYKILGFEAWMDESISEIYQLKDIQLDKFEFYLNEDSIHYKNPKFIEYAELFYEKYLYQLDKETKTLAEAALRKGSLSELTSALKDDAYIQTQQRAEFVTLLICKEAFYQGYLDRALIYELLTRMKKESTHIEHQQIANELLSLFKQMQIGMQAPDYILSSNKHFYQYKGKWVYLHIFDPANERCITEISALKKLQLKYGGTFQFVTI